MGDITAILSIYQTLGPWLTPIAFLIWGYRKYQDHQRKAERDRLRREYIDRDRQIMTVLSSVGIKKSTGRVDLDAWGSLMDPVEEED